MLLLNQAIVDIVNCLVYGVPNLIILKLDHQDIFYDISVTTLILTAASSLLVFTIIALERFFSLYKPVWHHVNVTVSLLWKAILATWLISITVAAIATRVLEIEKGYIYLIFLAALLFILTILITTLHMQSFSLAYKAVRSRSSSSDTSLKELRLVILFGIMYLIFVAGFTPLALSFYLYHYNLNAQTFVTIFMLISVHNPLLTMHLKAEFRIFRCRINEASFQNWCNAVMEQIQTSSTGNQI